MNPAPLYLKQLEHHSKIIEVCEAEIARQQKEIGRLAILNSHQMQFNLWERV